jgi:hypothetical protein
VRVAAAKRVAVLNAGTNSGLINLLGGEMEFTGTLANQGRISGRGMLQASTIDNSGSLVLSAGVSDVHGALVNQPLGRTIVTGAGNATFYGDVTNALSSEFRVSPGAIASFIGSVSGLSQFTGTGTVIFEGPSSFGRINKSGATIVGPFGNLLADAIIEASLAIEGAAAIVPNGANAATSRLNTLQILPGGELDLADNALVIDYPGATPRALINSYLTQGFAGGSWNGTGINSSVAASTPNRAIGLAEASDLGSPGTFAGQPVDGTSLLLRFTIPGDANLDRLVNIGDFALLAANFNLPSYWAKGDFNYNGTTSIADFALLAANFNTSLPRSAAVPEPGGLAIVVALGGWIWRRNGPT